MTRKQNYHFKMKGEIIMKKFFFKKQQNPDGYNEVFDIQDAKTINEKEIVILKGQYKNINEALKALESSDWYNALNYRFIKGEI